MREEQRRKYRPRTDKAVDTPMKRAPQSMQEMTTMDVRTGLPFKSSLNQSAHHSTPVVPSGYGGRTADRNRTGEYSIPITAGSPTTGFHRYDPQPVGQLMDYTETAMQNCNMASCCRLIFTAIVIVVCLALILLLLVLLSVI